MLEEFWLSIFYAHTNANIIFEPKFLYKFIFEIFEKNFQFNKILIDGVHLERGF